jgi:hypothetical protein
MDVNAVIPMRTTMISSRKRMMMESIYFLEEKRDNGSVSF